jgi:ATP-binding cassette subfamily B (MDR/TAP) protein 1
MNYALGFWFGAKLVSEKTLNSNTGANYIAADVIVIFFTLYLANLSLSGLP